MYCIYYCHSAFSYLSNESPAAIFRKPSMSWMANSTDLVRVYSVCNKPKTEKKVRWMSATEIVLSLLVTAARAMLICDVLSEVLCRMNIVWLSHLNTMLKCEDWRQRGISVGNMFSSSSGITFSLCLLYLQFSVLFWFCLSLFVFLFH